MNFDLRFYWRLLLWRLPVMMGIFLVCLTVGLVMAARVPTTYKTDARLLVEGAEIPGNLAESVVQINASESIEIIRQQLLTRANLLDIADELDVFPDYSSMSPDQVVGRMRSATSIRSRGGRGQPLIVTVEFEARTGQIAADVVNEYVTRIINANAELRTGMAENTLDFFEQEVERLATELDAQSARITAFQTENADALPDNLNFRMSRQALLQERIANAERERAALADQRARIISIYEATGQVTGEATAQMTPEQRQLRDLENELTNALTVYSETNPRVVVLQRRIETLRQEVAASAGAAGEDETTSPQSLLDLQVAEIDSQIAALETTIDEAEAELAGLEDTISRTPFNAISLRALQRDYDNIRRQYDNAVARLAQASTGERIELSARGQRISLIEAANVPNSPADTNQPLIAAMGAAVGLGLAGAFFVLLELLNRSVRRPSEITRSLNIVPLATIPYMESRSRRIWRKTLRISAFILVLVGVPAALWAIDQYFMPLDRLAARILGSLGLA